MCSYAARLPGAQVVDKTGLARGAAAGQEQQRVVRPAYSGAGRQPRGHPSPHRPRLRHRHSRSRGSVSLARPALSPPLSVCVSVCRDLRTESGRFWSACLPLVPSLAIAEQRHSGNGCVVGACGVLACHEHVWCAWCAWRHAQEGPGCFCSTKTTTHKSPSFSSRRMRGMAACSMAPAWS